MGGREALGVSEGGREGGRGSEYGKEEKEKEKEKEERICTWIRPALRSWRRKLAFSAVVAAASASRRVAPALRHAVSSNGLPGRIRIHQPPAGPGRAAQRLARGKRRNTGAFASL